MVMKMKKSIMALILFAFAFAGISGLTPIKAHASGTGSIGDVNVTVGSDGKLSISGGGISNSGTSGQAWTDFIKKYRNFIVGISGIGTVTMIMFFIFYFLKLGGTATNPKARQEVITGLVWSGVATAGLGAVTTFVGFFYGAFR